MKVYNSLSERSKTACVVTMGSFDGVHRGHRALLSRTVEEARRKKLCSLVLTYEPHPRMVLGDPSQVQLLTVLPEKLYLFEQAGLDETFVFPFDRSVAALEPEEYVERILLDGLQMKHLVVGYDHLFGRARRGNVNLLEQLAAKHFFELEVTRPVRFANEAVKSSAIREHLGSGRFAEALALLGHPFPLYGKKSKGHGRGKELGFPTFNLKVESHKQLPPAGVYAARVFLKGRFLAGMSYIGTCPTFGDGSQSVEVNVLEGAVDLGNEILVLAESFIRPDEKFATADELVKKMKTDEKQTRQYFASRGELAARGQTGGSVWL